MKILKKMLSVFLTAAIMVGVMCTGTVSANAAESDLPYVEKYVNTYSKNLGYSFWLQGKQKELWNNNDSYNRKCSHGHPYGFYYSLKLSNGSDTYLLECLYFKDSAMVVLVENGKGVKTNINLISCEYGWEYGFTFIIPMDNPYFEKLKNCTSAATYNCMLYDVNCPDDACGYLTCADGTKTNNEIAYTNIEIHDLNAQLDKYTNTDSSSKKKISSLTISEISNKAYTGKAIKPTVTVKDGSKKLVKGTDYTVSYKNNKNIGTASVTIKGKGNYTGSKTIEFKIVPSKTTLKAKKQSDTKVKLTWSKVTNAEKYQIYYSTNGSKYKKLATVSGSKTSYTNSKLDFKKNDYKFKIRAYDKVDGKTYYGSFSKVVTVK